MKIKILILTGLMVAPFGVRAQLVWDSRQLDFHSSVNDKVVEAHFKFQNVGTYPVTIISLKSACGCTTATVEKKTYAPGEKGIVTAIYTIGNESGLQQKVIALQSDDVNHLYDKLVLRADIPSLFALIPEYLSWESGEEKTAKNFYIKVTHPTPIKVATVTSDNPKFAFKLESLKEGYLYQITVTPPDTDSPALAALKVTANFPADNPKVFTLFAQVKEPIFGAPNLIK